MTLIFAFVIITVATILPLSCLTRNIDMGCDELLWQSVYVIVFPKQLSSSLTTVARHRRPVKPLISLYAKAVYTSLHLHNLEVVFLALFQKQNPDAMQCNAMRLLTCLPALK